MNFKTLNKWIGWGIFAIAALVYTLTVEDTASFWDCGEFIAVSYKLMVPHPPGAPFFLLVGRIFSFLAFGDVTKVAFWINMLSALSSAFTILFLFWSISFLARKVVAPDEKTGEYPLEKQIVILGASAIGALAYTFSDTFWFSAVEAEVYGMSSFFTAFVVWAMLRWDTIEDEKQANKWILLIAYMVGLSIGVHLLNLLAIPALGLLYYFKKYKQTNTLGYLTTLAFSGFLVVLVTYGVIPGLPSLAAKFEVVFVNGLGLPFGSGAIFFTFAIVGGLVYGIFYSLQKRNVLLNTALLSFAFILIGYTSYALVVIRSNANTPIDENNPEDVMSFISYLKREQYGDRPLLFGPTFVAERTDTEYGEVIYRKGTEKYEPIDKKYIPIYDSENQMLLPRIYSQSENHKELYRRKLGLQEGEQPTFGDNLFFLFSHQLGHMYFRYFMWNFAGRQSDEKEAGWLSPLEDLNQELPVDIAGNKARDNFYMLPLLLGMLGLFYQSTRDSKNFLVVLWLFFIMGIGLVLYLNSPPIEPRERDYVYAGSFYAFCMWLGFGVIAIWDWAKKYLGSKNAALFATLVSLVVPALMGFKGWDNHDRSGRYMSVDVAYNALAGCPEQAILFTGGDNDTFPLWYIQDVEEERTDVRVAVLSYCATDWYAAQMKMQMNESKPLPLSLDEKNYRQGKNDYLMVVDREALDRKVNLDTYLKLLKAEDPKVMMTLQDGTSTGKLLGRTFVLPVDKEKVKKLGILPKDKEDRIADFIEIKLKGNAIYKNDLLVLDLIANNNWERPICFNNTSANTMLIDLSDYLHVEGMTYRLLPIKSETEQETGEVNIEAMKENLAKYRYRGTEDTEAYYDDEYKKFASSMRNMYFRLAFALFEQDRKEEALFYIEECLTKLPYQTLGYDYYSGYFVQLLHLLEEDEKGFALSDELGSRVIANLDYLETSNANLFNYSEVFQRSSTTLRILATVYRNLDRQANAEIQQLEMLKASHDKGETERVYEKEGQIIKEIMPAFTEEKQKRLESLKARYPKLNERAQKYAAALGA
ncbi:glycosyltransferase family 117 protein [Hugenholtzia roseola]|uniref:glycosyltransferase family 117 protein n=1 Tax=Hugenholtzia roseola TaxID=1002 RepID=UPI00042141BC|nr:DUF2723 domain-containing protein [Hugenholtzia roseola]